MLRSVDGWEGEHFAFGEANASPNAASSSIAIDQGADGPTATIPDAHLLFNAHFSRAGTDLVLQGEGKAYVVEDYFASDVRARLLSPEGAAISPDVVDALAGPVAPGQYAQAGAPAAAAQAVGRVAQGSSDATIVRNGVAVAAQPGDPVLKGDVLQTVSGALGVTFNDGSTLNLTANTRMVVNEFVYDPQGTQNSQLLNLVQGSLTFISGEIAHNGNMSIATPVATMGIRGTVGGVTTANDGTVHFYVSQSATGAVILDSRGVIIANVVQDGPMIIVRPVGPLQVLAEEVQKTPGQLAVELAALQQILSIKAIGDQILQQNQQPNNNPNPNPQSTDKPITHIQLFPEQKKPGQDGNPNDNASDPNYTIANYTATTTNPDGTSTTHSGDLPPHVNVAPVLNFFNLAVEEGGAKVLSVNDFSITDPDSQSFAFGVSNVTGGTFQVWKPGPAPTQGTGFSALNIESGYWEDAPNGFTAADIAAGHVRFLHDGGNAAPTFTIWVTDGDGGTSTSTSATVTFEPVNDPPVLESFKLTVAEGGTTLLSSDDVVVSDSEASALSFTVSNVSGGQFEVLHGESWQVATSFSAADIADGHVRFVHDGSEEAPSFTITASDGTDSSEAVTPEIDFTSVNDAPVIESFTLAVAEGGETVLSLCDFQVTDPDSSELSFTVSNVSGGYFEVCIEGYWVEATSFSAGFIEQGWVRFIHNGGEAAPTFTITPNDGTEDGQAFSPTIDFTPVNDAPDVTISTNEETGSSVDEGGSLVFGLESEQSILIADIDSDELTVTLTATNGTVTLNENALSGVTITCGGQGESTITFKGTQADINAALDGLTFSPDGDFSGEAWLQVETVDDGGASSMQSVAITVNNVNDAPVAHADRATVSEEGLSGGLADSCGTRDVTNSATASGTICATDADGDQLSYSLGEPSTALCSGGVPICWEIDSCGTLRGVAGEQTIITVTMDADTGEYNVTLSGPVDHPNECAEDVKSVRIPVNVSDGTATTCTTLTVKIEDDSPKAAAYSKSAVVGAATSVNFVIMLDVSGSMVGDRIALAKDALSNLLSTTAVDINQVMVVAFSGSSSVQSWTDAATADTFIQGLQLGGGTNYDSAVAAVMNNWATGPSPADKTMVYFISDGEPTSGQGLDAGETTVWQDFLIAKHVDVANAIGISTGVNDGDLAPLAWAPENANLDPIVLTNATGLDATLQGTVPTNEVYNVLTDGGTGTGFGADGGRVLSVDVDGTTFTWDGCNTITADNCEGMTEIGGTSIIVATSLGGSFTFDFAAGNGHAAGDWSYTPPAALNGASDEVFHYVLVDNDGDTSGADITVAVTAQTYTQNCEAPGATLEGGAGGEIIVGGAGNDIMTGNGGADAFYFAPGMGQDTITDFASGVDKIVLAHFDPFSESGMSCAEAAFLVNPTEETLAAWKEFWTEMNDGSVQITLSNGCDPDTLTIANATLDSLHLNDFIVQSYLV